MSRGRPVEEVVVYARRAGESYWTAASQGYEEWVLAENAGDGPIAEWEVRGGSLSQSGEAVEITDAAGVSRMHVTAPEAFDDRGNSARAWLSVEGLRSPWRARSSTSDPRAAFVRAWFRSGVR